MEGNEKEEGQGFKNCMNGQVMRYVDDEGRCFELEIFCVDSAEDR